MSAALQNSVLKQLQLCKVGETTYSGHLFVWVEPSAHHARLTVTCLQQQQQENVDLVPAADVGEGRGLCKAHCANCTRQLRPQCSFLHSPQKCGKSRQTVLSTAVLLWWNGKAILTTFCLAISASWWPLDVQSAPTGRVLKVEFQVFDDFFHELFLKYAGFLRWHLDSLISI